MAQRSPARQIGRGMWILAWVVLLGLLFLYFEGVSQEKYNPNHALQTEVSSTPVVLKRNRAGHYLAPGEINGTKVAFLLDTGATTVSVPEAVANKIGLKRGYPQQVSTANGVVTVYTTQLDSIQLGSIELRQVRGHINPHMEGKTVLLGMSFMQHLEIRQKGDTLTLIK